tara:strand:- start:1625 stop:2470 length:846 start_codon:yes stop_codon:yes gene_type:complete
MIRPFFAGKFYETEFEELKKQIEVCYEGSLGPGSLPMKRTDKVVRGVLVPHGGYTFSGSCAAWGYKVLAEAKFAKTYVILCVDHYKNFDEVTTVIDNFETVFGVAQVDRELAQELIEKGLVEAVDDIKEHSLEVQLPFLQHACMDRLQDLKILPLIVPNLDMCQEIAKEFKGKDVCVIISSDFTHFGEDFNYVPFKYSIKQSVAEQDKKAISYILNLDGDGFYKFVERGGITICGKNAIALGVEMLNVLDVQKVEVLNYYSSSEIMHSDKNFVTYAALAFV